MNSIVCASEEKCLMPGNTSASSHHCKICKLHCHAICGNSEEGEEGYGGAVTCFKCSGKAIFVGHV